MTPTVREERVPSPLVGATIDLWLQPLTLASLALFLLASLLLTIGAGPPVLVCASVAI
jgi:hypothetical protein